ncbi:MAG TPA: hypothetical protein VMT04_04565, partial [Terriglobales bacterium]|nr:hypothetical protein [Terriglobales bacterium]
MKTLSISLFVLLVLFWLATSVIAQFPLPDSCGFTSTPLMATWSNDWGMLGHTSCEFLNLGTGPAPRLWYPWFMYTQGNNIEYLNWGGFWV